MTGRSFTILASLSLILSGCAGEGFSEFNFRPPTTTPGDRSQITEAVSYAKALSGKYLDSAGYIANDEQLMDVPTIGLAATAGLATLLKWPIRIISEAGVAGGTLYAYRAYYNGDARAKAMVNGALALRCIQSVAAGATNAVASDAWGAIDAIESRIFTISITPTPPDFASLAKTMSAQLQLAQANANAKSGVEQAQEAQRAAAQAMTLANAQQALQTATAGRERDFAVTSLQEAQNDLLASLGRLRVLSTTAPAPSPDDNAKAQFTACVAKAG